MMIMLRRILGLSLLCALVGLGGCATTGANPNDPLEGYNRAMHGFNDGLDKAVIKPLASGYKTVIPEFARTGVTNFFANLGDIWIGINNALQGKVEQGAGDFARFAVNSTAGILGLFDVASMTGLEKHNEDFGQTLGRWGVGSGAYVVLPLLGPSNVRDGFSRLFVDWHFDPIWYVNHMPTRNELVAFRFIEQRAELLDVSNLAEQAALDHYAYIRDAFQQRRRSLIYDGDPPREADPDKTSATDKNKDTTDKDTTGKDTAARADSDFAPARIVTERGERVITAGDAALTPAMEFAAAPSAEDTAVSVYEPKVPKNYDAMLAATDAVRAPEARTYTRP